MNTLDKFIEKETWNNGYAAGFKAGLEHAEKIILGTEGKLHVENVAIGMKNTTPRAVPILRQIIKEMWE